MIISVWRYSHLALAVSSFLLLTLAAASGIVLAFEPVVTKAKPYKVRGADTITLAQAVPAIKQKVKGIQQLSIDDNGFAIVKFSAKESKDKTAYINPSTGAFIGTPEKQAALFEWMTTLHRSLFLHETGRFIVGIVSFLLILIALSGIALVIQRQKGVKHFFSTIEKTNAAQYYHTVFGRLSLVFILATALTGTYLSVSRFIIKPKKINLTVKDDAIKEEPERALKDFAIFQQIKLTEVESIEFPFSDFPEDYYTLKLKDRQLCVNQITGDILAQQSYPASQNIASFSLRWHTGRANIVWAIVLAITSVYILFFIYSGLYIAWKRIRSKSKNKFKSADCTTIILVGSENGSTYKFASNIYKQLLKQGESVYLADLDTYTIYPKARRLLIMTSTYGEGDPPSNAKKFLARLIKYPQTQQVQFSVLGFGSRSYQHFCKFAYDVDLALIKQSWANSILNEVVTINEKSPQDFSNWLTKLSNATGLQLGISKKLISGHQHNLENIMLIDKTAVDADNAFLVRMKAKRFNKIASGDLLAIYPKNDHRERLYSIGKVNGEIQLSVKLYENGLGSGYLNALSTGQKIKANIIKNQHFHFPKKAPQLIMISNGTGIAPFLGMITENKNNIPCYLYCGFRTNDSFELYKSFLTDNISNKKLQSYHLALSRQNRKEYVSHLLQKDENFIYQSLKAGGVLMICGTLSMQKDVMAVLENICGKNNSSLSFYVDKEQILTDCY